MAERIIIKSRSAGCQQITAIALSTSTASTPMPPFWRVSVVKPQATSNLPRCSIEAESDDSPYVPSSILSMLRASGRKALLGSGFLSRWAMVTTKPLQQSSHIGVEHGRDIECDDLAKDQSPYHA